MAEQAGLPAAVVEDGDAAPARSSRSSARTALVIALLAAAFAVIPRATRGCEGMAALDEPAPEFKARLVANADRVPGAEQATDGRTLELARLRGHPVVLDFWATWCGPCQAEAPIVNAIAQRYRDRGLAVVGVNTSDEDGLAAYYVKKKGLGFPVVYDEGNTIAKQYGVSNLPTLVVISKEGKIVAVRHGVTSDSALDEIVRRYL